MVDNGIPGTNTSFVCIQVGGDGYATDQNNGMFDIQYVSCGTNVTNPTTLIKLDGYHYSLRHVYMENGIGTGTNAILIGGATTMFSNSITVDDVLCSPATDCIHISSGLGGTLNLFNIQTGGGTNLIKDTLTGGCTITNANETGLGFYSRGYAGRIVNTSSNCPKP